MIRAQLIVNAVRIACVVLLLSVCLLVFGPFQGLETQIGFSDKEAHALAFYGLCALGLMAMPNVRRTDIALVLLAFGAFIEVVQGFTGRSASLMDWLADASGVVLALTPMYFETLRARCRKESQKARPRTNPETNPRTNQDANRRTPNLSLDHNAGHIRTLCKASISRH